MEFLKLEKIELAGLRGRSLSDLVLEMFNEFNDLMNQFSGKSYDPLDITNKACCILDVAICLNQCSLLDSCVQV